MSNSVNSFELIGVAIIS